MVSLNIIVKLFYTKILFYCVGIDPNDIGTKLRPNVTRLSSQDFTKKSRFAMFWVKGKL